jgi:hypothetical protein
MKTRNLLYYTLIVAFALISCEKAFWKKDYRDKFVGKYQVVEEKRSYGPCGFENYLKDTLIVVDYGHSDSLLIVLGREVYPDKNGYFRTYDHEVIFQNDSIFSRNKFGGLGCGYYITHQGKRISSKP